VPEGLRFRVHQALLEASKDPSGPGYPRGMPYV
jgi:hypothetical protein